MAGTVSVACKMPNGLQLRNFEMTSRQEPVMGGGTREVKFAAHTGESVTVYGPATPFGQAPRCLIVGGYAITPGIDADFFAKWLKDNAESDIVKNRVVFAHEKNDVTTDKAKAQAEVKSGMEPVDQNNPGKGIEKAKV